MPRQYNIKWRVEDERELRRVARNFNDKLRRLVKENPENKNILPQFFNEKTQQFDSRITIQTLKSLIQTRQDYNRELNMLKRFSKRGAERIIEAPDNEYGSRTTVWQKNEMRRMASIVNQKRQERLDRLGLVEVMSAEGSMGYTLGQMFGMGLASRNQLQPTRAFTPAQSQTDLKQKLRMLQQEVRSRYHKDRDEILRDNYTRELLRNYDREDIQEVVDAIRKMPSDLFILKFEAKPDAWEYGYPPKKGTPEYDGYVSEMKGYWLGNTGGTDLSTGLTLATLDLLNQ